MLWYKGLLMLWAVVSVLTQLLLTGHCGTSVRGSRQAADGVLRLDTVSSVIRNSFGSLSMTRQERTSEWAEAGSTRMGGSE
jgi:hypothetical protein